MATARLQIYKCTVCGNMVEVIHTGDGTLTCCSEPMELFAENTTDAATEKHVPVVERAGDGVTAKVGSVPHPMEDQHYIEWIELVADGKAYQQFLRPGQAAEAFFPVRAEQVTVREYCNLHGLWKSE